MFVNIFRPHAISARNKGGEKPVHQEISKQKFVACHVPKQNWFPFFNGAAALSQSDKRPIPIVWVKPPVQDKDEISQPSSCSGADIIFASQSFEIVLLRRIKVPRREYCISLIDHRTLNGRERRNDVGPVRLLHALSSRAYGTASAPGSPRANPSARDAMSWFVAANGAGNGTARPSADRRKRENRSESSSVIRSNHWSAVLRSVSFSASSSKKNGFHS